MIPLSANLWCWRSRIHGPHHPCNGYVIRRGEECWLIDPPADITPDHIKEAMGGCKVTRAFITHFQAEHVQGLRNFPGILVHVPSGDEYLAGGREAYEGLVRPWAEPWDWSTRGNYLGHLAGAKNERPLEEPVYLDTSLVAGSNFCGFKVISTPGHGKHAVTLQIEVDGVLCGFCGDLICHNGRLWNWFDCDWDYGPETGQKVLFSSVRKLAAERIDTLFPSHGEPISYPKSGLEALADNLAHVLCPNPQVVSLPMNFPDTDSPASGFREISPHIHQWRTGNTIVLTSDDGRATVIDAGLCVWEPLITRHPTQDRIFSEMKDSLSIEKIEWIIPTHYHGDHIDGISRLAKREGARILALESIVGPLEEPGSYNLACSLPWYGTGEQGMRVDVKVPEGFRLPWQDSFLEFFHLGGQTGYHLGIQSRIDGCNVLFVGDAWWGTSPEPQSVLCWNDADPESKGWLYAVERMIERAPELLVCGHGSVIRNPLPLLEESRELWIKKLNYFNRLSARDSAPQFFSPFVPKLIF